MQVQEYPRDPILLIRLINWYNLSFGILIVLITSAFAYNLYKKGKLVKTQMISIISVSGYYYFLILATVLCRRVGSAPQYKIIPFWSYTRIIQGDTDLLIEALLNVLMMLPLGAMMAVIFKKSRHSLIKTVLVAAGCSLVIELLQLIFCRGMCEFDDVFHNTIGALLGYLLIDIIINSIFPQGFAS